MKNKIFKKDISLLLDENSNPVGLFVCPKCGGHNLYHMEKVWESFKAKTFIMGEGGFTSINIIEGELMETNAAGDSGDNYFACGDCDKPFTDDEVCKCIESILE